VLLIRLVSAAEARIDSIRKVDFSVSQSQEEKVSVELLRHEFPFVTALALYDTKDRLKNGIVVQRLNISGTVLQKINSSGQNTSQKRKLRKDELNEYF
jgi:endo-1,4-beta-xylanase